MTADDVAAELVRLADQIRVVAESVGNVEKAGLRPTAEAITRSESGSCLSCDKKAVKRGLCDSCYQKATRAVAAGRSTEAALIREGLLLPPAKPGKKSVEITRIDVYLDGLARIPGEPPVVEHANQSAVNAALKGDAKPGSRKKTTRKEMRS